MMSAVRMLLLFAMSSVAMCQSAVNSSNPPSPGAQSAAQQSSKQPTSQPAAQQSSAQPADADKNPAAEDDHDPLLDVPPLPKGKVTLLGGTVARVDQVRNRVTVQPFGGSKMDVGFDERTHIFRDGVPSTQLGIHKGDRVYVDTMLDGSKVFARNIRVVTSAVPADARGQVVSFDPGSGDMTLQDELSSQPVRFRVTSSTVVRSDKGTISSSQLRPGSLVNVKFSSGRGRGVANEILLVATPGSQFTFYGKISFIDMRSNTIALVNQSDQRTYDISFNPNRIANRDQLRLGANALIQTIFSGSGYTATEISFVPQPAESRQ